MATITSTPTTSNLTVSGTTPATGTISWSIPAVPSGAIISSCVLTGVATANMSKGTPTVTVNGTTVGITGAQFSINLGTTNSITSVPTTATGGNKNTSGTVKFSNLVYTVTYEEAAAPKPTYTVTFKDWNGTTLKTQTVEEGSSASAPSNPTRVGYTFTGWDKAFTNITGDLTVTAQYTIKTYTVTFKDWDGTTLTTQTVNHGSSATAPSKNPEREGYDFIGWDKSFTNITSDLVITAQYKKLNTMVEWTGVGTVASDLLAYAQPHNNYKINLDWENEYFDVIIKDELNYDWKNMNIAPIGNIVIGDHSFSLEYGDGNYNVYDNKEYICSSWDVFEEQLSLPQTLRFTKDGFYLIHENTPYFLIERPYEINQPIYIYEDNAVNNNINTEYDLKFDLVVGELPKEEPEEPEEPDNNELVQGDINEDGTFNDESTTVVRTKYIDISDKKSIQVTVLTDNVYISACYLYNANKELVKVIEIPADKKRQFGVNLQELIAQIIKDEGGDQ